MRYLYPNDPILLTFWNQCFLAQSVPNTPEKYVKYAMIAIPWVLKYWSQLLTPTGDTSSALEVMMEAVDTSED